MKTLLICHADAELDREGLARWLGSFSTLAGIVVIRETQQRFLRRVRREIRRVGPFRFLDVLAFRFYYRLTLSGIDHAWQREELRRMAAKYPPVPASLPVLTTPSPNSPEAEDFIRRQKPDLMLARCKTLLKKSVYSIPAKGTFVLHPGVCPEYRNAHGCFWALVNDDPSKVGATLLQIDEGVDSGPVYGYYTYPFDAQHESHQVIQWRVVLDNLDAIRDKLLEIDRGTASPIDTSGRLSGAWGQPWLSRYLGWKWRGRASHQ